MKNRLNCLGLLLSAALISPLASWDSLAATTKDYTGTVDTGYDSSYVGEPYSASIVFELDGGTWEGMDDVNVSARFSQYSDSHEYHYSISNLVSSLSSTHASKEGSMFDGWAITSDTVWTDETGETDGNGGSLLYYYVDELPEHVTFYVNARWVEGSPEEMHTVRFTSYLNRPDGEYPQSATTAFFDNKKLGDTITLSADFYDTLEGYEFAGFSQDPEATEGVTSFTITEFDVQSAKDQEISLTYYCVWKETSASTTTTPSTAPSSLQYDTWAESFVTFAEENALLVESLGTDYTALITREQIADLLVNMVEKATGKTLSTDAESFTDTSNEAVLKAAAAGIITGRGNGIFDPNSTANRQEISVMIVRAIEKMEALTGDSYIDHSLTTLEGYSDLGEASPWAQSFMAILANNQIMSGFDGKLNPLFDTTIQECLVFNNNLFKLGE